MDAPEILHAIQAIAVEQGKIVASLTGHVELDNERFRGMHEKLDRIEASTGKTQQVVESLQETRTFNRGRAWAAAKLVGLTGGIIAAHQAILAIIAWVRGH